MKKVIKKGIVTLLLVTLLLSASPAVDSFASQDVWSPFLSAEYTDGDALSYIFEWDLEKMGSEWEQMRDDTSHESELLSSRTENAVFEARIEMLEAKISLTEQEIEENETRQVKGKALLAVGDSTGTDLDSLKDETEDLEKNLVSMQKDLEKTQNRKEEVQSAQLWDMEWAFYGLDEETDFWRDELESLTSHALESDAGYCEAVTMEEEAAWTFWMDYTVRQAKGQNVPDEIFDAVLSAAQGGEIDEESLRTVYDEFLERIYQPYVIVTGDPDDETSENGEAAYEITEAAPVSEEEQESLFDALMTYQEKALARIELEETLREDIEDAYDGLEDAWENYISLLEKSESKDSNLKLNRVRYQVGEKTKEEYESVIEEYRTLDADLAQAKYEYIDSLYGMDMLTAGGLSDLLNNSSGAEEMPEEWEEDEEEDEEGERETAQVNVVTYLKSDTDAGEFVFGVVIPEDMEEEITHFELWSGESRIGVITGTWQLLRSPVLMESQLEDMRVLFYRDGEYVGECEIDPYVPISVTTVQITLREVEVK